MRRWPSRDPTGLPVSIAVHPFEQGDQPIRCIERFLSGRFNLRADVELIRRREAIHGRTRALALRIMGWLRIRAASSADVPYSP